MSWTRAPDLQVRMKQAARAARVPVLFIQAENDFDLAPTRALSAAMKDAGKPFEAKIYPPFGGSHRDGHSFAYRGAALWFDDVLRFLERRCAPAPRAN